MSFFELFQPGLKYLREEKERQKMLVSKPTHGGGAPLALILTRARPRSPSRPRPTAHRGPAWANPMILVGSPGMCNPTRPATLTLITKSTASPTRSHVSSDDSLAWATRVAAAQPSSPACTATAPLSAARSAAPRT